MASSRGAFSVLILCALLAHFGVVEAAAADMKLPMATWRSRRSASLDALARETLAKDAVIASCCGMAVLRSTPQGFNLSFGLAGMRRVSVSATEASFAKEVLHMLCAGDVAQLMPLISEETFKQVSAQEWRTFIKNVASETSALTEPQMVRKEDGWFIFHGGAASKQLEFKIAVDPVKWCVLNMTCSERETSRGDDAEELPSNSPVQPDDSWQAGSITKSMTATLAAVLRQKNLLPSEVTVAEALMSDSQLRNVSAESGFAHVTLEQLLTHRGGAWHVTDPDLWSYAWELTEKTAALPAREQRRLYMARMLKLQPREIGKFEYSNDGYSLAGVMIETLLDVSWEDLMTRELFLPLRMSSAGFGAPPEIWGTTSFGAPPEIWGTKSGAAGDSAVDPREPGSDNPPPALAPAGSVHCSLEDAARYMAVHLSAPSAAALLGLSPENWRGLHQVPGRAADGYAQGWDVERDVAGGYSLRHDGSNGMNYMRMKLWPSQGLAVVVALNMGIAAADIAAELTQQAAMDRWRSLEFTGDDRRLVMI